MLTDKIDDEASSNLTTLMTIMTGFHVSGKTTFVNYILKEPSTRKIAVLENDFGEVPIDDGFVTMMDN